MSSYVDDPKQTNSTPESDAAPVGETDSQSPDSTATPLPDFSEVTLSAKQSQATPSNLNDILALSKPDTPQMQTSAGQSGPVYRVSPATPDLSGYAPTLIADEAAQEAPPQGSAWKTAWAIIREVGETVILTLLIFLAIQMVIRNFRVVGTSMVNNLHDGQYLIIDKLSYNPYLNDYLNIGGPQRGDVIVFEPPRRPDEDYVKRIIGLPGEEVQVVKGQVFINGEQMTEPFEPMTGSYTMPAPVLVPEDYVFVLGDNRNNSNDSHNWGPLPVENIVGRAWLSYWPPDQWGTIPRDIPTEEATLKHFVERVIPNANAQSE